LLPALEQLESAYAHQRLGHAWLIHGPEGIGKTNLALVFATRLLEGAADSAPDALAPEHFLAGMSNRHEAQNHHPDLHWLYPESGKASISVEQVRGVSETLGLSSYSGSAKVVVIEPADALTIAAANALLKTLEEPTRNSYLLLVSHRPGVLPATVRSRCQQLRLQAPQRSTLTQWFPGGAAAADDLDSYAPQLAPLRWLESLEADRDGAQATRSRQFADLVSGVGNPLAIADDWAKGDTDHTLDWLTRRLQGLIRARCDRHGSKLITESADPSLHNAASALSLTRLFDRLEEAERLRRELAGGINVQLAMRALVLGFVPDKGLP